MLSCRGFGLRFGLSGCEVIHSGSCEERTASEDDAGKLHGHHDQLGRSRRRAVAIPKLALLCLVCKTRDEVCSFKVWASGWMGDADDLLLMLLRAMGALFASALGEHGSAGRLVGFGIFTAALCKQGSASKFPLSFSMPSWAILEPDLVAYWIRGVALRLP